MPPPAVPTAPTYATPEPDLTITIDSVSVPLKLVDAREKVAAAAARPQSSGPQAVRSPMPGKVVKLLGKVGDTVTVRYDSGNPEHVRVDSRAGTCLETAFVLFGGVVAALGIVLLIASR